MSDLKYESILKDQFARVIRYAYPGFFAVGLLAINFRDKFPHFLADIGMTYLLILTFVLGAVIYVIYRFCLGEFIIFLFVHFVHWLLTLIGFPMGITLWLGKLGVPWLQKRDAYTFLRIKQTNVKDVRYLDYVHTELHILYITSLELFCFWFFIRNPSTPPVPLDCYREIAIYIFVAAMVADIRSHVSEARFWRYSSLAGETYTKHLLEEGGFKLLNRQSKISPS